MGARTWVPSPIGSVSSCAETANVTVLPSTAVTVAVAVWPGVIEDGTFGVWVVAAIPGGQGNLDIAAITLFLCSPAARYINGASIVADGGYYFGRWTDMHDPEAIV